MYLMEVGMSEKDAYTIIMEASRGRLTSQDRYKGKKIISVIDVALDAINELNMEIARLNYIIKKMERDNQNP